MSHYTIDVASGEEKFAENPAMDTHLAAMASAAQDAKKTAERDSAALAEAVSTLKADAASSPVSAALVTILGL